MKSIVNFSGEKSLVKWAMILVLLIAFTSPLIYKSISRHQKETREFIVREGWDKILR